MKSEEKKKARFGQTAEEISPTFIPQCHDCKHNIMLTRCKKFDPKPSTYTTNQISCPEFVKDS